MSRFEVCDTIDHLALYARRAGISLRGNSDDAPWDLYESDVVRYVEIWSGGEMHEDFATWQEFQHFPKNRPRVAIFRGSSAQENILSFSFCEWR